MKLLKVLIPLVILALSILMARQILSNPPEAKSRPAFARPPAVEAITLKTERYQVLLNSQGTLEPSSSNTLVAEVAGTIESVSDSFVVGGRFKEGELLILLDQRDYQIALTQAQAQLAQANALLQEEYARGKQAKVEWESLQRGRKPTALNLRKPQLAASRANRDAARAQVERAELDLQRTKIIAPYDGKVSIAETNLGQFVNRGSMLGEIYATDNLDIRLPLTSRQQVLLDEIDPTSAGKSQVKFRTANQSWQGNLIRIEGVETTTQQFNVIARLLVPATSEASRPRAGQFIQAQIYGQAMDDVFVIPLTALRNESEVLLLIDKERVQRQTVKVVWQDETSAVISDGLQAGQILVTTPLSVVADGAPVLASVDGKAPAARGKPAKGEGQRSSDGKRKKQSTVGNDS